MKTSKIILIASISILLVVTFYAVKLPHVANSNFKALISICEIYALAKKIDEINSFEITNDNLLEIQTECSGKIFFSSEKQIYLDTEGGEISFRKISSKTAVLTRLPAFKQSEPSSQIFFDIFNENEIRLRKFQIND